MTATPKTTRPVKIIRAHKATALIGRGYILEILNSGRTQIRIPAADLHLYNVVAGR